jgi:hypothetical protein
MTACLFGFLVYFSLQFYKEIYVQFMIFGRTALGIIVLALLHKGNF